MVKDLHFCRKENGFYLSVFDYAKENYRLNTAKTYVSDSMYGDEIIFVKRKITKNQYLLCS